MNISDKHDLRRFLRGTFWVLVYTTVMMALVWLAWWPFKPREAMRQGMNLMTTSSPTPPLDPTATSTETTPPSPTVTPSPTLSRTASSTETAPPSTPTGTPTPSTSPTTTPTSTYTATVLPTNTLTPMEVISPTATIAATATPTLIPPEPHLWLERPVSLPANNRVDRFYPYGTTGEDEYPVHHGVEFINPTGTVVLAMAPAKVEFAGDDREVVYSYRPDFYGKLVILRLEMKYKGKPVYILYGHLSEVFVQTGQLVEAGEPVGEVGMTGVALGPHLHLEVRVGENSYWATRNPELWLHPLPGEGIIAGQVVNGQGKPLLGVLVAIAHAETPKEPWRQTRTYITRDIKVGGSRVQDRVNPDDEWPENWAMGDIPAGEYLVGVHINDKIYTRRVSVRAGEISYVRIVVP